MNYSYLFAKANQRKLKQFFIMLLEANTTIQKNQKKRKNILFVAHDASVSGAPLVLLEIFKTLKNSQYTCDVLLLKDGTLTKNYELFCKNVFVVKKKHWLQKKITGLITFRKTLPYLLKRKLKKNNYDAIFSNTVVALKMAVEVNSFLKTLHVSYIHELDYAINTYIGKESFIKAAKEVDFFLAVSKTNKLCLSTNYLIDPDKIQILHPVPTTHQTIKNNNYPVVFDGVDDNTFVIGGSGHIMWTKGFDIFMLIADEFSRQSKNRNFMFVWVGKIPLDKVEYEKFVFEKKKLNLRNMVFTGEVSNPIEYYKKFSVFLLSSKEDSFPLVALENAMLQNPVVCFENTGGINEWVKDGGGVEVPYCDIGKTVKVLIDLWDNAAKRTMLGNAAYDIVSKRYNIEVFNKKLLSVFSLFFDN